MCAQAPYHPKSVTVKVVTKVVTNPSCTVITWGDELGAGDCHKGLGEGGGVERELILTNATMTYLIPGDQDHPRRKHQPTRPGPAEHLVRLRRDGKRRELSDVSTQCPLVQLAHTTTRPESPLLLRQVIRRTEDSLLDSAMWPFHKSSRLPRPSTGGPCRMLILKKKNNVPCHLILHIPCGLYNLYSTRRCFALEPSCHFY